MDERRRMMEMLRRLEEKGDQEDKDSDENEDDNDLVSRLKDVDIGVSDVDLIYSFQLILFTQIRPQLLNYGTL